MMSLSDFFEPYTARQKRIKWIVILLIILIGSIAYLTQLDEIVAYERTSKNPVYVEATMRVEESGFVIKHYDTYLVYTYNGKVYEDVYYIGNQSPGMLQNDGKPITVSIDPENPGALAGAMLESGMIVLSLVILSLGMALLFYGIGIENEAIRKWRTKVNRVQSNASAPDYLKDVFLIFLPSCILSIAIFAMVFPNTVSIIF